MSRSDTYVACRRVEEIPQMGIQEDHRLCLGTRETQDRQHLLLDPAVLCQYLCQQLEICLVLLASRLVLLLLRRVRSCLVSLPDLLAVGRPHCNLLR